MSILIKGVEMPKDYSVIVKIFPDGRVGAIHTIQWFKADLIPGTQAVSVPPHGRLIDADALRAKMYHEAFETDTTMRKWDSGCWIRYKMFERMEEDAPTIIQTEEV